MSKELKIMLSGLLPEDDIQSLLKLMTSKDPGETSLYTQFTESFNTQII